MDLYYLAELMGLEATIDDATEMRETLVNRGLWQYTDDIPENEWLNLRASILYKRDLEILNTIEFVHGATSRDEAGEFMRSVYTRVETT